MLFGVVVLLGVGLRVEVLLHLLLNDGLRHWNLDQLHQLIEHLVACFNTLLHDLGLGSLRRQVSSQLLHGVELASQLSEVVVRFGQFAALDGLH